MGHPTTMLRPATCLALVLIATLAATSAIAADAEMYRCQNGDEVTFSQEPCGDNARQIDVQYTTPTPTEAATTNARVVAEEAQADLDAEANERELRIKETEREIENLHEERDRAITELRVERQHGTEDRDDDGFRQRKTGEMRAVRDQYDSRIQAKEIELQQLLEQ